MLTLYNKISLPCIFTTALFPTGQRQHRLAEPHRKTQHVSASVQEKLQRRPRPYCVGRDIRLLRPSLALAPVEIRLG